MEFLILKIWFTTKKKFLIKFEHSFAQNFHNQFGFHLEY